MPPATLEITYLTHKQIDKKAWNIRLRQLNAPIYAHAFWLDVVSPNWHALVAISAQNQNEYLAVMPLPVKYKFGCLKYLMQPRFTQQLGIFGTTQQLQATENEFMAQLKKQFLYIHLQGNINNDVLGQWQRHKPILKTIKRQTFCLNLNQNYQQLFQNCSKRHQRSLKKVINNSHLIIKQIDYKQSIQLFSQTIGRQINLNPSYYDTLHQLFSNPIISNYLFHIGVFETADQKPIAALSYLVFGQDIVYLLPSANEQGKEHLAGFLLINHLLETYANRNLILDFEGSDLPSLADFYKGFGSQAFFYPYAVRSWQSFFGY